MIEHLTALDRQQQQSKKVSLGLVGDAAGNTAGHLIEFGDIWDD
jgi:hypothetical protein